MKQLQEAGFNRVLPNVWSRGTTFHQSAYAPVESALQKAKKPKKRKYEKTI